MAATGRSPSTAKATRRVLAELGDPHLALPHVLHVTGTNGKGSTVAMLESVLRQAGYRTGLFASPHLSQPGERVRVDFQPLSLAELQQLIDEEVWPAVLRAGLPELVARRPNILYACAGMLTFARRPIDVAVIEVNAGGKHDATNVFPAPLATAITTVHYDHTALLGETLTAIATAKSGILRPGVPVVTGAQGEALSAIRDQAEVHGAPLILAQPATGLGDTPGGQRVRCEGPRLGGEYELGLRGDYQRLNVAIVLAMLEAIQDRLPTPREAVRTGLATVRWPARLERAVALDVHWLFDGAHNQEGAASLQEYLLTRCPDTRLGLVYGVKADRPWQRFAGEVKGCFDQIWTTRPPLPMATVESPEVLAAGDWGAAVTPTATLPEALFAAYRWALAQTGPALAVVAGQLNMVGAARDYLKVPTP